MKQIIDLLNAHQYYGGDEAIEIAKGKFELATKPKSVWVKIKRKFIKYFI